MRVELSKADGVRRNQYEMDHHRVAAAGSRRQANKNTKPERRECSVLSLFLGSRDGVSESLFNQVLTRAGANRRGLPKSWRG
ncbi:hypothetical protein LWI29_028852 [Acer saccharum]|uniref:Uncharacterized protein n=1 Tax=Acer saccharum TaxID=4024 RepID=A0AA39VTT8_ACESA|nr:hypothetical protein LWI29_028852 [Acer saccharum]